MDEPSISDFTGLHVSGLHESSKPQTTASLMSNFAQVSATKPASAILFTPMPEKPTVLPHSKTTTSASTISLASEATKAAALGINNKTANQDTTQEAEPNFGVRFNSPIYLLMLTIVFWFVNVLYM